MILGTGAYKRGLTGTVYRPVFDAGWGCMTGGAAPVAVRSSSLTRRPGPAWSPAPLPCVAGRSSALRSRPHRPRPARRPDRGRRLQRPALGHGRRGTGRDLARGLPPPDRRCALGYGTYRRARLGQRQDHRRGPPRLPPHRPGQAPHRPRRGRPGQDQPRARPRDRPNGLSREVRTSPESR